MILDDPPPYNRIVNTKSKSKFNRTMELHVSKRRKIDYLSMIPSNPLSTGESISADSPTHNPPVYSQNTPTLPTKNGSDPSKQSLSAKDSRTNSASDSSFFRLQIQELLAKVRPSDGSRMEKVEVALRKLKRAIELIPNREQTTVIFSLACTGEISTS